MQITKLSNQIELLKAENQRLDDKIKGKND